MQNTNKLSVLRTLLHRDNVKHNESQMHIKTELSQLNSELATYKQNFDSTLGHIQDLQQVVFTTLPFELVEDPTCFDGPLFEEKLF